MPYKINALKKVDHTVLNSEDNPLETLSEIFETKDEALSFIKNNIEVVLLGTTMDVFAINYNNNIYHYFQLENILE